MSADDGDEQQQQTEQPQMFGFDSGPGFDNGKWK